MRVFCLRIANKTIETILVRTLLGHTTLRVGVLDLLFQRGRVLQVADQTQDGRGDIAIAAASLDGRATFQHLALGQQQYLGHFYYLVPVCVRHRW